MNAWAKFAEGLTKPFFSLISEVVTDKDEANRLAHELATLASKQGHTERLGQLEVNKVEAAHKSLFVAGWRPAAGWTCVIAIFNNYVLAPYVAAFGEVSLPTLDLGQLMPVLLGMLGLTAARSWEKSNGVAREH